MSINDGQRIRAAESNAAWVSKTSITGNQVTGIIILDNSTDITSGSTINNAQAKINDNADRITQNEADIAQNQLDIAQNTSDISANTSDIADIRTTTGTSDGDIDMGAFTGGLVTNNSDLRTNLQEIIDAILSIGSPLTFRGTWDASTNTPTLASGVGTQGDFYIVNVAGSTTLDGISDWQVNDWAVFDGTVWRKIDNSEIVTSVNGQTGNVTLVVGDLDDVDLTGLTNGQALIWNSSTMMWEASDVASAISSLTDVVLTSLADGQILVYDSGTSKWINKYPSASGGSGYPLLSGDNSTFESSIGDWQTYADAAGSDPVDMDGGTPNVTFTRNTTSPLVGSADGLFTKDAANRQGEGLVLQGVSVPTGYQGQPLLLRMIVKSGGSYVSGDAGLYWYDETNAGPVAISMTNDNSGEIPSGTNIIEALVFPASNTASIRFGIHVKTTNASAWTLNIDQVEFGWVPYVQLPGVRTQTIDLTSSGSFTGGEIVVQKIDRTVVITTTSAATFSSSDTGSSASGLIPEWARPSSEKHNTYTVIATDGIYTMKVASDGTLSYQSLNSALGGNSVTTVTALGSITYIVDTPADTIDALAINSGLYKEDLILSSDVSSTGSIADLASTSLKIGTWYLITGQLLIFRSGSGADVQGTIYNSSDTSSVVGAFENTQTGSASADGEVCNLPVSILFKAKKMDLRFVVDTISGSSVIRGDGTKNESFITISEFPFSQTALASGTIYLGQETWTDSEANCTTTVRIYKSGKLIKIFGDCNVTGAFSGSAFDITIPSSYTASSKYSFSDSRRIPVGDNQIRDAANAHYEGRSVLTGINTLTLAVTNVGSTYASPTSISSTIPMTWANGDRMNFSAEWEVEGW